jgi:hypothetical protein
MRVEHFLLRPGYENSSAVGESFHSVAVMYFFSAASKYPHHFATVRSSICNKR